MNYGKKIIDAGFSLEHVFTPVGKCLVVIKNLIRTSIWLKLVMSEFISIARLKVTVT